MRPTSPPQDETPQGDLRARLSKRIRELAYYSGNTPGQDVALIRDAAVEIAHLQKDVQAARLVPNGSDAMTDDLTTRAEQVLLELVGIEPTDHLHLSLDAQQLIGDLITRVLEQAQQIATLTQTNKELMAAYNTDMDAMRDRADAAESELVKAKQVRNRAERDRVKAEALHQRLSVDLQTYGRHGPECMVTVWEEVAVMTLPKPDCTCGFDAALTGEQK